VSKKAENSQGLHGQNVDCVKERRSPVKKKKGSTQKRKIAGGKGIFERAPVKVRGSIWEQGGWVSEAKSERKKK